MNLSKIKNKRFVERVNLHEERRREHMKSITYLSDDEKDAIIKWSKEHNKVPNDVKFGYDKEGHPFVKSAKVRNFRRKV
jgi:hypothetical protein